MPSRAGIPPPSFPQKAQTAACIIVSARYAKNAGWIAAFFLFVVAKNQSAGAGGAAFAWRKAWLRLVQVVYSANSPWGMWLAMGERACLGDGRPNFGSIAVPVPTALPEGGCGAMGRRYLFGVSSRAQAVSGAMYSLEDESQERPKAFPIEAS